MKNFRLVHYLKIARFDHWIKQLFILPGSVFAFFILRKENLSFTGEFLPRYIAGFMATCLIASANYVINEFLDADFDKFHPTKKNRPVVTQGLKARFIWIEYALFSAAGFCLGLLASFPVFAAEAALWLMGIIYNVRPMRSKEIPYIDVLSESVNNALRLLIGWFLVSPDFLPTGSIVFGYWFGGAFLMAAKRFAEFRMFTDKEQAALYRKSFKHYSEKSLLISALFYAMLSVFFVGVFMIKYRIELLFAIPFLCGLFCIYFNICYKHDSSAQRPEKLFKEKGLLLYIAFFAALISVLMTFHIPFLNRFLDIALIRIRW